MLILTVSGHNDRQWAGPCVHDLPMDENLATEQQRTTVGIMAAMWRTWTADTTTTRPSGDPWDGFVDDMATLMAALYPGGMALSPSDVPSGCEPAVRDAVEQAQTLFLTATAPLLQNVAVGAFLVIAELSCALLLADPSADVAAIITRTSVWLAGLNED